MSSLCHIQDAYSDNNMDELDRMARAVNNNNRSRNIKNVLNDYNEDKKRLESGIRNLQDIPGFNFFSTQGDYSKYKNKGYDGTLIKDIHRSSKKFRSEKPESITLDSPNSEQDIESSDNSMSSEYSDFSSHSSNTSKGTIEDYSINLESLKKHKSKSKKHVRFEDECMSCDTMSLDSFASEEDMINHASKCAKCKRRIMKILKNNKKPNKKIENIKNDVSSKTNVEDTEEKSSISNLKEFIIICGIGLLVIFILDFVLRTIRH